MSELNTTPDPTPETDKATVTTDWMTGKPVVPADFARRLERERDKAREREKSLLLRLGQEKDHSEHVMARLNDSDTLRLAMFADLTTLRARVAELEAATALTPSHLLDELADLRRDRERLMKNYLISPVVCGTVLGSLYGAFINTTSPAVHPNVRETLKYAHGLLSAAIDQARAGKTEGGV